MTTERFDRRGISDALARLGELLAQQGKRGDLFMVGGAAIAPACDDRRVTRDIDALFEPKMVIYALSREVAAEMNLPDDWLNDAVKGFLSPTRKPDPSTSWGSACPGCVSSASVVAEGERSPLG